MAQDFGFKVVTLDEGDGPVKVIKDAGGRLITAEQMATIRQKQDADVIQATDLRDKLVAGDAAATAQVVGQVKDGLSRQLALFDRQKADTAATLARLEASDPAAVGDVIKRMTDQLNQRVDMATAARDRSDQMLTQVAAASVGKSIDAAPATPAAPVTSGS